MASRKATTCNVTSSAVPHRKHTATFLIIKPTRCTNFTNLFWHEILHISDSSSVPSSGVYSLYTQQWYMSYRFVDSCWAGSDGPARKLSVWHIPLLSVQWINSWWWTDELSETCRVSCQNKFVKLVRLVGFIIKKYPNTIFYTEIKGSFFITQGTPLF